MLPALIACAFALCATVVTAEPQSDPGYTILMGRDTPQAGSLESMMAQLNRADVVFVGENHDHKQGHTLELTLLTEMHRQNPAIVLSLEMFERDVQPVVDEYLHDYITESSFLQAARPWPNYKDDYRPLVEFCKENHVPVVAANAPRRYVNIVSRKGQQGLKPLPRAAKAFLTPLPYSMEMPAAYSQQLDTIFGAPHGTDANAKGAAPAQPMNSMPSPDNLKQAQALWDACLQPPTSFGTRRYSPVSRTGHQLTLGAAKNMCSNLVQLNSTLPDQLTDVTKFSVIANGQIIAFDEMIAQIERADVVFMGEEHDDKTAHALELAVLKALYAHNSNLALSMEMFERDVQPVLNEYLEGYITEGSFLQASRPWPNYKDDYRPLVEFCKENHLPVVAANAPRRYVNLVSRKGPQALAELPKESKIYLPHLPYSLERPEGYDHELTGLFGGQHDTTTAKQSIPTAPMPSVANLKAAQSLWDVSMQDSISRFLKRNRRQVLQINGSMHSDRGFGIVYHFRKASPQLKVVVVTVKRDTDYMRPSIAKYANLADFIFVSPKEAASNE